MLVLTCDRRARKSSKSKSAAAVGSDKLTDRRGSCVVFPLHESTYIGALFSSPTSISPTYIRKPWQDSFSEISDLSA